MASVTVDGRSFTKWSSRMIMKKSRSGTPPKLFGIRHLGGTLPALTITLDSECPLDTSAK